MKRISRLVFALGSTIMCLSAYATIPNNDFPTPLLGPTLRMSHTSFLTDTTAYSFAGELGVSNIRGSATFAWKPCINQRLKFTAEILSQQLTYTFFTGNDNQWVTQGAIGGAYAYDFDFVNRTQFDIAAYYSYAASKSLSTETGTFLKKGVVNNFVDVRHIAGSSAAGISPGVSIQPWVGARAGLELNYDYVAYRKKYGPDEDAKGLGGTAFINTLLTDNIGFSALAGFRRPFNNYEADFYWQNLQYMGRWTLGLYGEYVDGKETLPNFWNLGVHADYYFDPTVNVPAPVANLKGERDLKGEVETVPQRLPDSFLNWTADPAVRMPVVLAVPDEQLRVACVLPVVTGTLPNDTGPDGLGITGPNNYSTAQAFSGKDLVFSVTFDDTGDFGDTVTIDPVTGLVTVTPNFLLGQTITVHVTATNRCGSVTSSFTVLVFNVNS